MRPRQLSMTAFGPYKGTQHLHFDELGGHGLFLMHGPTGAGKTSILDAICVALFGESSGAERKAKEFRSDLADDAVVTQVEFEFSLGQKVLRVRRQPLQSVPGRKTPLAHEAELWERGVRGELRLLATGVTDVNRQITELLGLTCAQFRQVVVLPQGRFRELLTADSKAREDILKVLFDTAQHAQLEKTLKEIASNKRKDAEQLATRRDERLKPHGVLTVVDLDSRLAAVREEVEALQPKVAELKDVRDASKVAVETASSDSSLFGSLDQAEQRWVALERAAPERQERAQVLRAAVRAQAAEPEVTLSEKLALRFAERQEAWQISRAEWRKADDLHRQAVQACQREEDRSEERSAAKTKVQALEALKSDVSDLTSACNKRESLLSDHAQVQRDYQKLSEEVARLAAMKTREQVQEAEQAQERVPFLETSQQYWSARVKDRRDLDELTARAENQKVVLETAAQAAFAAQRTWARAKKEHGDLRERFLDNQAGILAGELQPDQPCQVCGSPVHPRPAVLPQDAPTEQQVKQAQADEDRAYHAHQEEQEKAKEAEREAQRIAERVDTLRNQLGEHAATPLSILETEHGKVVGQLKAMKDVAEQMKSRQATHEETTIRLETLQGQIVDKRDEEFNLGGRLEELKAQIERLEEKVPEHLRLTGALQQELEKAQTEVDVLQKSLKEAQEAAAKALDHVNNCRGREENGAALCGETERSWQEQEKRAQAALRTAGFEHRKAYEDARRSVRDLEALQQQVKEEADAVLGAEIQLKNAQEAVSGRERPDLDRLNEQFIQADQEYEDHSRHYTGLKGAVDRLEQDLAAVNELEIEHFECKQEADLLTELASQANGQGGVRVSYHRYVLAYYLEEVLRLASLRLRAMTRDRYDLRLAKDEKGGLELEVFDHYTGRARSTRSLSGGESFQAALSLALSLGEVVQQRTGSRHLETVFVDEGFGTLDPDALDSAMDCLAELQQNGRLVGVISHVQELQQHIPVRLEVTASQQGSHARFIVP